MGATEQVSVSGGCFRKERRTLLQIYNMRSLYPMTTLSMEHLEPLSFESRMEVQESNIRSVMASATSFPPGKQLPVQQHSRASTQSGQLCPDRGGFVVFEQFNLSDPRFRLIL